MCGGMEFNGFGLKRRTVLPDKAINVGSKEHRLGRCCRRAFYDGLKEGYEKNYLAYPRLHDCWFYWRLTCGNRGVRRRHRPIGLARFIRAFFDLSVGS